MSTPLEPRMIHPTATVDPAAELAAGVTVGPYAFIDRDTHVGEGCVIGPHAVLHRYTSLGPGCRVHAGAVLGDLPQDLAFQPDTVSYVRIGARCLIREGVTIHRGTKPDTVTEIGDDCFLMANSHLAHNVKLGRGVILVNGALLAGYVEVGDNAFISGNAVVHQFVRIGRLAMLGGLSGVSKDVPPFCTTRSGSVNTVVGLNVVGLRRAGFTPAQRQALRMAFKKLYLSDLNVSQALERIRADAVEPVVGEFCDFIEQSRRGICRLTGADESPEGES